MHLLQLEEWERDLILEIISGNIGHPDEVSDGLKRLIEKLTKPEEAEIELTFYVFTQNNGDGSACARFFNMQEEADDYAEKDNERFCDDIYPETIIINGLGEIKDVPKQDED